MFASHTDNRAASLPRVDETLPDLVKYELPRQKTAFAPSTAIPHIRNISHILEHSGRWLLASDCIALTFAFFCGGAIAWLASFHPSHPGIIGHQPILSINSLKQFCIFMGLGALALLMLDMRGHYRQRLPYWEAVGHILMVSFIGFTFCGFLEFVARESFSRLWLVMSWALFAVFLFTGRGIVRRMLDKAERWKIPAIMIGSGYSAEAALKALAREPEMGFNIIKHIAPDALGSLVKPHAWKRLLMIHGGAHIFLALDGNELAQQQDALKALMRERLPCSIIPPWMGLPSGTLSTHHFLLHDVMMLHDTNRLSLPLPCLLKRSFDIACSGLALLALAPVFLVVAAIVRMDGGPAFFQQPRVGRSGKTFGCYKFRSMRVDAEDYLKVYLAENPEAAQEWQKYQKLKNDVRITAFGQWIRRLSIDELPQLINVLKGDMSLVGPRPIMVEQAEFYGDDFTYYKSVRPGISGPWQVSGRNQLSFPERVKLECTYARNWSLWLDIVILLKTLPALLKRDQAF
jgi:undecaprenyl-phosphate galactose phosphotransferase